MTTCLDQIRQLVATAGEVLSSEELTILDKNGKKMNDALKDHIAEPVSLTAKAVQYDDWILLYTNKESIKRTGGLSWFKLHDETVACGPGRKSKL